jgi:hypothetical protein
MYGLLDALFLAFYAVGLYIRYALCSSLRRLSYSLTVYHSGLVGDRHDIRRVLIIGMTATGL